MATIASAGFLTAGVPQQIKPEPPSRAKRILHTVLLASTIPFTIVSLIPSLRLVGSLGVRSISLLSSILNFTTTVKSPNKWLHVTNTLKIGVVVCGIAALTASLPMFIIISLVSNIAIELFELAKAIYQNNGLAIAAHTVQIITDALVLSAILTGSIYLLGTAVVINGVGLTIITFFKQKSEEITWDLVFSFVLTVIAVVPTIILMSEFTKSELKSSTFVIKAKDKEQHVYGNHKLIAKVNPGEELRIEVPAEDIVRDSGNPRLRGLPQLGVVDNTPEGYQQPPQIITAIDHNYDRVVTTPQLEAGLYPQVCVGAGNNVRRHYECD